MFQNKLPPFLILRLLKNSLLVRNLLTWQALSSDLIKLSVLLAVSWPKSLLFFYVGIESLLNLYRIFYFTVDDFCRVAVSQRNFS